MQREEVYEWLIQSERRKQLLTLLNQPMTATQMAGRLDLSVDVCSYLFWESHIYGLIECLNAKARCSRLYGLTPLGRSLRRRLLGQQGSRSQSPLDDIDWDLYGQMLFRHREAVIRALIAPMRPPMIKRRALQANPALTISVANVRDVLYRLLKMGVVRRVQRPKEHYASYELTARGKQFRELMLNAGVVGVGGR